jgi:hypothetical protein
MRSSFLLGQLDEIELMLTAESVKLSSKLNGPQAVGSVQARRIERRLAWIAKCRERLARQRIAIEKRMSALLSL